MKPFQRFIVAFFDFFLFHGLIPYLTAYYTRLNNLCQAFSLDFFTGSRTPGSVTIITIVGFGLHVRVYKDAILDIAATKWYSHVILDNHGG